MIDPYDVEERIAIRYADHGAPPPVWVALRNGRVSVAQMHGGRVHARRVRSIEDVDAALDALAKECA